MAGVENVHKPKSEQGHLLELPPAPVGPDDEPSEDLVRAYDASVQAAVQALLDQLRATA